MKRVVKSSGFTIVETMIVLAVTGMMFVLISGSWGGKQRANEYTTAVQDVRSRLQQAIADVENGYFPDTSKFSCSGSETGLDFTSIAGNRQGTNLGCVFLGKAVQFRIDASDPERINQYSVAGWSGALSSDTAKPTLAPGLTEAITLRPGLKTVEVKLIEGGNNYLGVAFLSDVGARKNGELQSGRQSIQVYGLSNTASGLGGGPIMPDSAVDGVDLVADRAQKGIQICLQSTGTSNFAVITIAADGSTTDVRTDNKTGGCGL